MVLEMAEIGVRAGMEAEFEAAVARAAPLFRRARGCRGLKLRRSLETPLHYLLFVEWESLDDHMVHFRNSEDFGEWRRLVGHCFDGPPKVGHSTVVLDAF